MFFRVIRTMNLTDMLNGEPVPHLDLECIEAAYNWKLNTPELELVFHHIVNCPECYDNFFVVMVADLLEKNPCIAFNVPGRLSDKLAAYIDSKP